MLLLRHFVLEENGLYRANRARRFCCATTPIDRASVPTTGARRARGRRIERDTNEDDMLSDADRNKAADT
jgi:hypothetical protein